MMRRFLPFICSVFLSLLLVSCTNLETPSPSTLYVQNNPVYVTQLSAKSMHIQMAEQKGLFLQLENQYYVFQFSKNDNTFTLMQDADNAIVSTGQYVFSKKITKKATGTLTLTFTDGVFKEAVWKMTLWYRTENEGLFVLQPVANPAGSQASGMFNIKDK